VAAQTPSKEISMRFMMIITSAEKTAGVLEDSASRAAFAAMSKYNDELKKSGILLAMDGLTPVDQGTRFTYQDGKTKRTDGPFAESKEVIAGYWMIEVKSREEALEWASRVPGMPNQIIEVRRVFEIADFPEDIQKKFAEKGAKLGNQK
jgi:hypothetical protein